MRGGRLKSGAHCARRGGHRAGGGGGGGTSPVSVWVVKVDSRPWSSAASSASSTSSPPVGSSETPFVRCRCLWSSRTTATVAPPLWPSASSASPAAERFRMFGLRRGFLNAGAAAACASLIVHSAGACASTAPSGAAAVATRVRGLGAAAPPLAFPRRCSPPRGAPALERARAPRLAACWRGRGVVAADRGASAGIASREAVHPHGGLTVRRRPRAASRRAEPCPDSRDPRAQHLFDSRIRRHASALGREPPGWHLNRCGRARRP